MAQPFIYFDAFVEEMAQGGHDLSGDTLKVMLTDEAPTLADTVKGDMVEIGAGNGYTAGGPTVSISAHAQASGTFKLVGTCPDITAAGGTIGPFRYAVLYNSSKTNKLIGAWDYGQSITLQDGEKLAVTLDGTNGILQVAKAA